MANLQTKRCSKCKKVLSTDNFYPAFTKDRKPTLRSSCKECNLAVSKAKYDKKQSIKLSTTIESLKDEIWMPIANYPLYMVSNFARVKRLGYWKYKEIAKKEVYYEEILLSQTINDGYHFITLYKGEKYKKVTTVYSLVYFAFNPQQEKIEGYEVDHIDNNRSNSKLNNLQYIKGRDNSAKRSFFLPKTSKYTGVSWDKTKGKWTANVKIKEANFYLGRYDIEEDASNAYLKALKEIELGVFKKRERDKPLTSTYKGVCFNKKLSKWIATFDKKYLGVFNTEEEASQAYQTALANLQNKAA